MIKDIYAYVVQMGKPRTFENRNFIQYTDGGLEKKDIHVTYSFEEQNVKPEGQRGDFEMEDNKSCQKTTTLTGRQRS